MEFDIGDAEEIIDDAIDEVSDISDSDIDDYESYFYAQLKSGSRKVKFADNAYRCPFCVGKKKRVYFYKDLLQHAIGVGASNRNGKERAGHYALAKFMKNDLPNSEVSQSRSTVIKQIAHMEPKKDDLLVWPWMGILVNHCERMSNVRENFEQFNVLKVKYLQDPNNFVVILEFGKDWEGLKNAMAFDYYFESKQFGRREWVDEENHGNDLFGWVARIDDYNGEDVIGEHLRSKGDVKTVIDLAVEESHKTKKLLEYLVKEVAIKNKCIEELEVGMHENTRNAELQKGHIACQICNKPDHIAMYCRHRFDRLYPPSADILHDLATMRLSPN